MRYEATIFLDIYRKAANRAYIPSEVAEILCECLGISEEERLEIADILKADAREYFAMHPDFEIINALLNSLGK